VIYSFRKKKKTTRAKKKPATKSKPKKTTAAKLKTAQTKKTDNEAPMEPKPEPEKAKE